MAVPITTTAKTRQMTLLERTVMLQFGQAAPLLDRLKIKDIGTTEYAWASVTSNVSGPDYSAPGAGFPSIFTNTRQQKTLMSYFGFRVDVDKRQINDKNNLEDPRTFQTRVATKEEAFFLMSEFFEGNPNVQRTVTNSAGKKVTVNPLPGVRYALDNRTGANGSGLNNLKIDAGGVNVSKVNNSPTNARKFARLLDEVIPQCGDGQGTGLALCVGFELLTALGDIMRQGGMFKTTADSFGRQVPTWGEFNIPIIYTGLKTGNSQVYDSTTSANRVIGWEDATGVRDDASNFSSAYLLDFSDDGILGVEQYGMEVRDLGLQQSDGVTYSTVVDWSLGLAYRNPNCVARIYDIQVRN